MTTQLSKQFKKGAKRAEKHFPKIYRIITEGIIKPTVGYYRAGNSLGKALYTRFSRGFTEREQRFFLIVSSSILLAALLVSGYSFVKHVYQVKEVQKERARLVIKEQYWQHVVATHPEYRDGYFQLAVTAYQLGEKSIALANLQKTLTIDPNFSPAKELERMINE